MVTTDYMSKCIDIINDRWYDIAQEYIADIDKDGRLGILMENGEYKLNLHHDDPLINAYVVHKAWPIRTSSAGYVIQCEFAVSANDIEIYHAYKKFAAACMSQNITHAVLKEAITRVSISDVEWLSLSDIDDYYHMNFILDRHHDIRTEVDKIYTYLQTAKEHFNTYDHACTAWARIALMGKDPDEVFGEMT